jgi:hypothetical protein
MCFSGFRGGDIHRLSFPLLAKLAALQGIPVMTLQH